jgi:hypothetical protein
MPVNVVGVEELTKGLNYISEDIRDRINIAIKPAMEGIRDRAKSYVPSNGQVLSGWIKGGTSAPGYRAFPRFDSEMVKGGIEYKQGENRTSKNGFTVSNYVYNSTPGGGIYETAGRLNPQGRAPFMRVAAGELGGIEAFNNPATKFKKRGTGSYNSDNPFAGYQFVSPLPPVVQGQVGNKYQKSGGRKTKGRLIYKAWAKDSHKVYEAIIKAVDNSVDDFNNKTLLYPKAA